MSYSDKAVMEVHAKQGSSNRSITVESPLNNLTHNLLCSWAARAIESNPKISKCNGKHKEQEDNNNCELHHLQLLVCLFGYVLAIENGVLCHVCVRVCVYRVCGHRERITSQS